MIIESFLNSDLMAPSMWSGLEIETISSSSSSINIYFIYQESQ